MERPYFDIVASGQRMRDIRKARKISVRQVMEYMGFESTQAVYKWEAGRCYPQADNLLALAKLYNVSPMELLVEEDSLSSSLFFIHSSFKNIWKIFYMKNFYMRKFHNSKCFIVDNLPIFLLKKV